MKQKVSDIIAGFLEEKGIEHGFGIIGSANAHIFDSIFNKTNIDLVCQHHEQACTMAVQTYWKVSGQPTFALVTAGAGSSNAITGVLSAWADSIPCLVISGQENVRFIARDLERRMYGIQGFDSPEMVRKITKYSKTVMEPESVLYELEKAWHAATTGRPGPCWIDIPMDVQGASVEESELLSYSPPVEEVETGKDLSSQVKDVAQKLRESERPLLWLGVGIRMAEAKDEIQAVVDSLGLPFLVTWSAMDLLPSDHPFNYGSAGVYGQRAANFVLQSCDYILSIGSRLAIPQVGYVIEELARDAKTITAVDIDAIELSKYPGRVNDPICADAKLFLEELAKEIAVDPVSAKPEWLKWCSERKGRFPKIGPEHDDSEFINSYRFMDQLKAYLKPDQVIVTDMGTALLSGHQALSLSEGQRLITSQGLGEMGFGLPGAIGASFATGRGEVLCLNCDGGMMMNLQELQTIAHHNLPIKIVVFNNDGYLMIKHTQKSLVKGRYSGTDEKSGVSCPDFTALATAFGFPAFQVRTWEDFEEEIPNLQNVDGPAICEVFMDPEQFFVPKLGFAMNKAGVPVSPPLEDLSPLLSLEEIEGNLIPAPNEKSILVRE